jgi:putative transcriptional regulator
VVFTVRQARTLAGLTQEQMAKQLGLPVNTYRRHELNPGMMRANTAVQLAQIANLPIDQIFFGSNLPKVDNAPCKPA